MVRCVPVKGSCLNLLLLLPALTSFLASVRSQPPGVVIPLSEEDAREILATHNFLRGVVDPPASNMQTLVRERDPWGGVGIGGKRERTKEGGAIAHCSHTRLWYRRPLGVSGGIKEDKGGWGR